MAQFSSPLTEHSIDVLLETDSAEILVKDKLLVSGRDSFRFRLAPWLSIENLLLDGVETTARRHRDGRKQKTDAPSGGSTSRASTLMAYPSYLFAGPEQ